MRLVRLPTIRSKHLETVVHTLLSTAHAVTQRYDVVHYHALGPALFSLLPRLDGLEDRGYRAGAGLAEKKVGTSGVDGTAAGERASVTFPNATMVVSQALQQRYREAHGMEAFYVPNGGVLREWREPRQILEWGTRARQLRVVPGQILSGERLPSAGRRPLSRSRPRNPRRQLVMAGASSYCDDYSQALRTHASDRIRMLDWVSGETLDELLTNAMIFVLPSDLEGLVAGAARRDGGRPCVLTSDVPENREVVDGAGFTFQCGNALTWPTACAF